MHFMIERNAWLFYKKALVFLKLLEISNYLI